MSSVSIWKILHWNCAARTLHRCAPIWSVRRESHFRLYNELSIVEVNYKVDNRTLEQRTRVRLLLLDSLKYSWTSVVDSINMINGDNSLDDDAQLIPTSGIHVSFEENQQQQQADEAMERDTTTIDQKSLFTSALQVARVVTTKLTGLWLFTTNGSY